MQNTPQLSQVISWAKHAGQMVKAMQQGPLDTQHKSKADLVTAADKASEAYLLGEISVKQFSTFYLFLKTRDLIIGSMANLQAMASLT